MQDGVDGMVVLEKESFADNVTHFVKVSKLLLNKKKMLISRKINFANP